MAERGNNEPFRNPNDFLRSRMASGRDFNITAEEAKQLIRNTLEAFLAGYQLGYQKGFRKGFGSRNSRITRTEE